MDKYRYMDTYGNMCMYEGSREVVLDTCSTIMDTILCNTIHKNTIQYIKIQ